MRRTKRSMAAAATALGKAWRCGLAAIAVAPAPSFARAEETASIEPGPERQKVGQSVAEYERVSREISLSEERKASLAAEIGEVKKDAASITAALIQSAKTERKLGQDIEDNTDRVEA